MPAHSCGPPLGLTGFSFCFVLYSRVFITPFWQLFPVLLLQICYNKYSFIFLFFVDGHVTPWERVQEIEFLLEGIVNCPLNRLYQFEFLSTVFHCLIYSSLLVWLNIFTGVYSFFYKLLFICLPNFSLGCSLLCHWLRGGFFIFHEKENPAR